MAIAPVARRAAAALGNPVVRAGAALGAAFGVASFAAWDAVNLYNNQSTLAGRLQGDITFPEDLNRDSRTPFMSMQFSEYRRRSINDQPFFQDLMNIRLPLPKNLVEQTSVQYEKSNLGSALGATVDALSGSGATRPSLSQAITQIAAGAGVAVASATAQEAARRTGVDLQAVQQLTDAASVLTGITTNPFQVILFKAPHFRSHTFSWTFIPQSQRETEELKKLVDTFRYHTLPGISSAGGVFFSYPEILKINFRPSDQYLYKFKPCVVDSVTVNYAPNGPSFFKSTGAPTAIQFELRLQEIEIWTKSDDIRVNGRLPGGSLTMDEIVARNNRFLSTGNGNFDALGNFQPGAPRQ